MLPCAAGRQFTPIQVIINQTNDIGSIHKEKAAPQSQRCEAAPITS